ncbi:MAG TPA: hypothetical protein VFX89_15285 [Gammaproteobacteria bacterium]|nr:hypothetical protein [Gammaproteobacteria bacterium]
MKLAVSISLALVATAAHAQWLDLKTPGIPRTADGKPDLAAPAPRTADGRAELTGLWRPTGTSGDLHDESKIQDWAVKLRAAREANYYKDGPHMQCLPNGPAAIAGGGGGGMRRIVQSPTVIAILNGDLTYRQIFTDGRALEKDPLPIWMGYSVGRWDGDTLVVESNGYNGKTWLHTEGLGHTEKLRITERYRRLDFGHLQLDVTYDDPGTFDQPLHVTAKLEYAADDELLETVCNEATEGGTKHWVGDKTADGKTTAVAVDPKILDKYVGTYRGYWLDNLTTLVVMREDGGLVVTRNGGKKSPLFAQSETTFVCPSCQWGQPYIFEREGDKPASQVSEIQVSGAWVFKRVN